MRTFIIKFLYIGILAGLVFCVFKFVLPLFMPFVVAFFIAFLLKKPIDAFAAKTGQKRTLIAVFMLILVYLGLAALLILAGARLFVQISLWFAELPHFYKNSVEPAAAEVFIWLDNFISELNPSATNFLDSAADSLSRSASGFIASISSGAIAYFSSIATRVPLFLVSFFLCIIASFFFVVDYHKVTQFLLFQLSPEVKRRLAIVQDFSFNVVWRFARAYMALMSLTFLEMSVGLLILGVPSPFLIAFFTAILDVLPVFGTGAVLIPWVLYSFFTGEIGLGVGLAVLYGVITIVRQILEPRVVGRQIGLYPLLTLMCMFIGTQLFGIAGLLGLPITLTVLIHLNRAGEIAIFKENKKPQADKPKT